MLDQKLQWLAEHAEFDVTINSVVGGGDSKSRGCAHHCPSRPELGFSTTVGIIHDDGGQLLTLDDPRGTILEAVVTLGNVGV